jgi:hypothetical protein
VVVVVVTETSPETKQVFLGGLAVAVVLPELLAEREAQQLLGKEMQAVLERGSAALSNEAVAVAVLEE